SRALARFTSYARRFAAWDTLFARLASCVDGLRPHRALPSFPTRRSSDLGEYQFAPSVRLRPDRRPLRRRVEAAVEVVNRDSGGQIGRAHVWTPVTSLYRMPSSACKKKIETTLPW